VSHPRYTRISFHRQRSYGFTFSRPGPCTGTAATRQPRCCHCLPALCHAGLYAAQRLLLLSHIKPETRLLFFVAPSFLSQHIAFGLNDAQHLTECRETFGLPPGWQPARIPCPSSSHEHILRFLAAPSQSWPITGTQKCWQGVCTQLTSRRPYVRSKSAHQIGHADAESKFMGNFSFSRLARRKEGTVLTARFQAPLTALSIDPQKMMIWSSL
jgi:hypothetical protein